MTGTKVCTVCGTEQSVTAFATLSRNGVPRAYRSDECRKCRWIRTSAGRRSKLRQAVIAEVEAEMNRTEERWAADGAPGAQEYLAAIARRFARLARGGARLGSGRDAAAPTGG